LAGASAAESELEALKAAAQLRIATGQLAAQFQPAALTSGNRRVVVARDAMPLTWSQVALSASTGPDPDAWPLPAEAFTHPRTWVRSGGRCGCSPGTAGRLSWLRR
jgi:hypothetical protein